MKAWHTCDSTHCRGGWVVFMAGAPGKELEKIVGTAHAALQIYHKSCPSIPVAPVRFYEKNEVAMADIIRCAELEKKQQESK